VLAKRIVILVLVMIGLQACGTSGASVDTIDRATLKEGAPATRTLKFWMKERGVRGDDLADNAPTSASCCGSRPA
jgi:hypothetical protein